MKRENIITKKSFDFAVKTVNLYKSLVGTHKEYVLSRQLLKSGTSVGANVRESQNAESTADFIHKLSIAQKECHETIYWLDLLKSTSYLNEKEYFKMNNDAQELLKIIRSIILTTKQNRNYKSKNHN